LRRFTMTRRDEILEKIHTVPAMPTSASKVLSLLKDPGVDIKELLEAIEYDQGLTSNILRLANSVYFAGPRSIASLRDAIVRLGMNRIFQLVITSAITPFARQSIKGYDLPRGALLEHSVVVAIGAEELAGALKTKLPPQAFTAGLLHDLGKVVLGTFLEVDSEPISQMAFSEQISFEKAEYAVLGINHAETGAALLESWNLPSTIVDVVRWHHEPSKASGDPLVADLVHVADTLALTSGIGAGIDGLNYRTSADTLSRLQLKPGMEEQVLCKMLSGLDDLRNLFVAE
jgi:putative nucleotidyltransferase with HDIG domain